jgi:hypothetical protein
MPVTSPPRSVACGRRGCVLLEGNGHTGDRNQYLQPKEETMQRVLLWKRPLETSWKAVPRLRYGDWGRAQKRLDRVGYDTVLRNYKKPKTNPR